MCINTKRLSFTLLLLLDKSDEGIAKKTVHWTEQSCSSKRSRLNTSTVLHLPESKIKKRQREKEESKKDREIERDKERKRIRRRVTKRKTEGET